MMNANPDDYYLVTSNAMRLVGMAGLPKMFTFAIWRRVWGVMSHAQVKEILAIWIVLEMGP